MTDLSNLEHIELNVSQERDRHLCEMGTLAAQLMKEVGIIDNDKQVEKIQVAVEDILRFNF